MFDDSVGDVAGHHLLVGRRVHLNRVTQGLRQDADGSEGPLGIWFSVQNLGVISFSGTGSLSSP